jgi:hypothetical protein
MIEELISGGVAEWFIAPDCLSGKPSTGFVGSNPTPSTNFATEAEALTSAPVFNHTQPKLRGPKQPKLYAVGCVSQIGAQQWTNNRNENSAAW